MHNLFTFWLVLYNGFTLHTKCDGGLDPHLDFGLCTVGSDTFWLISNFHHTALTRAQMLKVKDKRCLQLPVRRCPHSCSFSLTHFTMLMLSSIFSLSHRLPKVFPFQGQSPPGSAIMYFSKLATTKYVCMYVCMKVCEYRCMCVDSCKYGQRTSLLSTYYCVFSI